MKLSRMGKTKTASTQKSASSQKPLPLLADVPPSDRWSARRVNQLIDGLNVATSYLEIGVFKGRTLVAVKAPFKWGVDPQPLFDAQSALPAGTRVSVEPSDEFFGKLPSNVIFDVAFLDGLHVAEQAYRDVINAFRHAHHATAILVDDVVPDDDLSAIPDERISLEKKREAGITNRRWHGDVWKIAPALRQYHPELTCKVIHTPGARPELGEDNLQLLVSFTSEETGPVAVSEEALNFMATLSDSLFSQFSKSNPEVFAPVSDEAAIASLINELNSRKNGRAQLK